MTDPSAPVAAVVAVDGGTLNQRISNHAALSPDKPAITDGRRRMTYAELDRAVDRVAAALQRDGVAKGRTVASIGDSCVDQVVTFLGTLRAGAVAAPMQPSASPGQLRSMINDADAALIFTGRDFSDGLGPDGAGRIVRLEALEEWIGEVPPPHAVAIEARDGFNIIYSSGTTGIPKGIVQTHAMRAAQFASYAPLAFEAATTLIATPLYSNTTLVALLPTLAYGGMVVLMGRFDARRYVELAQAHRVTHTMLVPIQYRRIMALPDFDRFDLSTFRLKICTSAPFPTGLKADVVRRWPGALLEFYGMTEGGGSTVLNATENPDKLHTVGTPAPGHDIRLIDDDDREVAAGETGEIVGRSSAMMSGYHGRGDATAEAFWVSPEGGRFIRQGDVGRFDEDGFLILLDRKKDMIISGGFNIYPSDIEAVLMEQPGVADCAVVGVPSEAWGETPFGFFVARAGTSIDADAVLAATNAALGKTQRLSALRLVDEIPRSHIGKVLKRDLRERAREAH